VLNLPIVSVGLITALAQFRMGIISTNRFRFQFIFWLVALIAVAFSFPIYNYFTGQEIFQIRDLSLLDIVLTTSVVYLLYALNRHRQKINDLEKSQKDLHRELSIKLSEK
jgi:hypothetical protein